MNVAIEKIILSKKLCIYVGDSRTLRFCWQLPRILHVAFAVRTLVCICIDERAIVANSRTAYRRLISEGVTTPRALK